MSAYCWHTSRDEDCKMDESFSGDKRLMFRILLVFYHSLCKFVLNNEIRK